MQQPGPEERKPSFSLELRSRGEIVVGLEGAREQPGMEEPVPADPQDFLEAKEIRFRDRI